MAPEEKLIDALTEILIELDYPESQARSLRNTALAKGVILHKIRQLKARVPVPKHADARKAGGLQHLNLPGQKELEFNGLDDHAKQHQH